MSIVITVQILSNIIFNLLEIINFNTKGVYKKMGIISEKERGQGVPFCRIRRITGYLTGDLTTWGSSKIAEEHDRVKHVSVCNTAVANKATIHHKANANITKSTSTCETVIVNMHNRTNKTAVAAMA